MSTSSGDVGRRLSVGAALRPGESLPGFVLRLSERARFTTADRLAAIAGMRQPGSAVTKADLSPLAGLAGSTAAILETAAYRPVAQPAHHRFLGATVSREFLRLDVRRFCPLCLKTSSFHRARWDLALVTACAGHSVRLLDRCSTCGKHVGWRYPSVGRCRCGADLLAVRPTSVTAQEAHAAGRLEALFDADGADWLPAALRRCEAADLVRLLMCLGMFLTGWTRQRRIETLVTAGPDAIALVTVAGVDAFENWPHPIHRFLKLQDAGAGARRGRYGARKSLGAFYDWLTLMEKGPVKDALSEAAADYVGADPVLARRTHRSKLLTSDTAVPAMGLREAGGALGAAGPRVRKMMVAGMLPAAKSEGRGVPMLVDRTAVEKLAAVMSETFDLGQTASTLNISKARVRALVEGRVLSPVHRGTSDGWGRWAFAREEVFFLPGRLAGAGPIGGPGRTIGFDTAAEAYRRRGVGLAEMVAAIERGELPVHSMDPADRGLKGLRFSAASVRAACRSREDSVRLTVQVAA